MSSWLAGLRNRGTATRPRQPCHSSDTLHAVPTVDGPDLVGADLDGRDTTGLNFCLYLCHWYHMPMRAIYRAATDLTKHHLDDVAGRACVQHLKAFAGGRSFAIQGPIRAFVATTPIDPDPLEAAVAVAASGRPVAVSIAIYRAMPGLGDDEPRTDVAELAPVGGGHSYWFAASRDWALALDPEAPVLLFGQAGAPPVALPIASLRASFDAAATDRTPILNRVMLELVTSARNRALAELFTKASIAAMQERQALLADATASLRSRRLSALGAVPLVPLRVTREELDGEVDGPIPQLLSSSAWTIRQPVIDDADGRISRYINGCAGATMLARNFGGQPSRLLCLDPGRLEFDVVRTSIRRVKHAAHRAIADPLRGALATSQSRESTSAAQDLSTRTAKPRSVYGNR